MLGSLLGLFRMLVGGGGTMILPPELCCWKKKGELFMWWCLIMKEKPPSSKYNYSREAILNTVMIFDSYNLLLGGRTLLASAWNRGLLNPATSAWRVIIVIILIAITITFIIDTIIILINIIITPAAAICCLCRAICSFSDCFSKIGGGSSILIVIFCIWGQWSWCKSNVNDDDDDDGENIGDKRLRQPHVFPQNYLNADILRDHHLVNFSWAL